MNGIESRRRAKDRGAPEDLREGTAALLPDADHAAHAREPKRRRWPGIAACIALAAAIGGATLLHGMGTPGGPDTRGVCPASSDGSVSILETPALPVAGEPAARREFTNSLYLRVAYGAAPEAPSARIIGTADSLADFAARFPEDDLSALTGAYGDSFFEKGRLLAVVLEEPSGSIRHELDPDGLTRDSVTVLREVPEGTAGDMAAWLLLAEVGPEFSDGDALEVVLEPQP